MLSIYRIIILMIFFSLFSCGSIQNIGMVKHRYNINPKKIIWLQIPGIEEEHIALIKFNTHNGSSLTSLEQFTCLGKIWNYNLYNLRPTAAESFMSQMIGRKNIKNTCEDYKNKFIWSELGKLGFSSGVLEIGISKKDSLSKLFTCSKSELGIDNPLVWSMSKSNGKNSDYFHYQEKFESLTPRAVYDKSCQQGACFSSPISNIRYLYDNYFSKKKRFLFIIRDFTYLKALTNKKIVDAKGALAELNSTIKYIKEEIANNRSDTLLIVSSSAVQNFEFPKSGRNWERFESKGRGVKYRRRGLMSSVWATGAKSENFCGIYDEAEIFHRILLMPKESLFSPSGLLKF